MELKEGMYVRTDKGLIDKILLIEYAKEKREQYPNHPSKNHWRDKLILSRERYWRTSQNIIKASFEITDLIEVGDVLVVDGIKYTVLQDKEHCNNILHIKTLDDHYSTIKYLFEQNSVESILTKEQFEREAYKL